MQGKPDTHTHKPPPSATAYTDTHSFPVFYCVISIALIDAKTQRRQADIYENFPAINTMPVCACVYSTTTRTNIRT